MASTARDIVSKALSQIGVDGRGRDLSAEDTLEGFDALNNMLSAWSAEGMIIPNVLKQDGFNLSVGTTEYSVSLAGDIPIATPIDIDAVVITHNSHRYNLSEYSDFDQYLKMLRLSNATPTNYLYEHGKLFVGAKPDLAYGLELWVINPLTEFSNLSEESAFPDYFTPAMIYNLAVMVAPSYGKEAKASVAKLAYDFKFAAETRSYKGCTIKSDFGKQYVRSSIQRL